MAVFNFNDSEAKRCLKGINQATKGLFSKISLPASWKKNKKSILYVHKLSICQQKLSTLWITYGINYRGCVKVENDKI